MDTRPMRIGTSRVSGPAWTRGKPHICSAKIFKPWSGFLDAAPLFRSRSGAFQDSPGFGQRPATADRFRESRSPHGQFVQRGERAPLATRLTAFRRGESRTPPRPNWSGLCVRDI